MGIDLIKHSATSSSQIIQDICAPIFNLLGATFFRYLRVYPDGSRIHLCTDPNWTEHFYSK